MNNIQKECHENAPVDELDKLKICVTPKKDKDVIALPSKSHLSGKNPVRGEGNSLSETPSNPALHPRNETIRGCDLRQGGL